MWLSWESCCQYPKNDCSIDGWWSNQRSSSEILTHTSSTISPTLAQMNHTLCSNNLPTWLVAVSKRRFLKIQNNSKVVDFSPPCFSLKLCPTNLASFAGLKLVSSSKVTHGTDPFSVINRKSTLAVYCLYDLRPAFLEKCKQIVKLLARALVSRPWKRRSAPAGFLIFSYDHRFFFAFFCLSWFSSM